MNPRRTALLALTLAALTLAPALQAQDRFPSKPMTLVVPASPGGAIDLAARLIGNRLSQLYGQPVSIDNRTGATGIVGTELVAKAAPDGHTLALVASSHAINPGMYAKLPFDTIKSFAPVAQTHSVPLMLVVAPSLPVKTLPELIAWGRANPGKLSFASSGKGGAPHMSGELFKSMTGLDMLHIPYKGSTLAHPDLISGRTAMMFDTVAAIATQVKSGNVRAIAVTTARRTSAFPDLPTMQEAGLKGYDTSTWGGLLAPAGTPREVVNKLNADVNRILAEPEVRDKLNAAGIDVATGTPQQFADFIQNEMTRWLKVARDANIQPE